MDTYTSACALAQTDDWYFVLQYVSFRDYFTFSTHACGIIEEYLIVLGFIDWVNVLTDFYNQHTKHATNESNLLNYNKTCSVSNNINTKTKVGTVRTK